MSAPATAPGVTEATLLAAWEDAVGLPRQERGAAVLRRESAAEGDDPGRWPLGRHDARLLDLHARQFGELLTGTAECPACAELVELSLPVEQLRTTHAEALGEHELRDKSTGHRVRFRLLCAEDLALAARAQDVDAARRALLARCVLGAERDGEQVAAEDLPPSVVEELGHRMTAADPQAELRVELTCPGCEERWLADVEPAAFVWRELEDRAQIALGEVAELAAAYGWSERDVLGMSPERRRAYLELARA
jgi:hypothetical protein